MFKFLFRLPAFLLEGLMLFIFGSDRSFPGVIGGAINLVKGLLSMVKSVFNGLTNLVSDNTDAIASAFWVSLLVGGAAALTVAYSPAALAAVVGFKVLGYSIASVVGSSFTAQVAATAGVGAVLGSAAVYSMATVINFCRFVSNCCFPKKREQAGFVFEAEETKVEAKGSATALSQLGGSVSANSSTMSAEKAPTHVSSLHKKTPAVNAVTNQQVDALMSSSMM